MDHPDAVLELIQGKVAEYLSRLPNYTCRENIDRLLRPLNGRDQFDHVELEVAFVGKRELFARPGESSFQEQSATKLVGAGTISSGLFGSFLDSIFREGAASFDYIGAFEKDGRKTYRYDYKVRLENSRFLLKHSGAESLVAYQGSFWADFNTFDLVELEIDASHIPAYMGVRSAEQRVRYATVRIRDSDFLLPLNADVEASDVTGTLSLNSLTLEHCREFTGESTVTFGAPVESISGTLPSPASRAR